MSDLNWRIPYLTADLPGIGGIIRAEVEDFIVEEVPAYEACGEGEHTFFGVEKRDLTTHDLVQWLARALEVPEHDFGLAGLKDARAIARQTLSVQNVPPERLLALEPERARILWAKPHTNKLRRGHLRGNRFTLRIRGLEPGAEIHAAAILDTLIRRGVPNGYGPQRFGRNGDNADVGLLVLRREWAALRAQGIRYIPKNMHTFYLSALQSALFNRYLVARMEQQAMDGLLLGDVAKKQLTGGLFTVEDVAAELPRVAAWEISPTGPIYGYKMLAACDQAGALEARVLAEALLTPEDFRPAKLKGSRRPLRYYPEGLSWHMEDATSLSVSFFAPKGAFATMLLRELMKTDAVIEEEDTAEGDGEA